MEPSVDLKKTIQRIDGKGYKAYKDIERDFTFNGFELFVDHVQGDPYSAPSPVRARIERANTSLRDSHTDSSEKLLATEDFLTRLFSRNIMKVSKGVRGTGTSGLITIQNPGQAILKRSSVVVTDTMVEFRFQMSLPARGRTILGRIAESMFFQEMPDIVNLSSRFDSTVENKLRLHINTYQDYCYIKRNLAEKKLLAFIPNASILPRKSGIDDRPLSMNDELVIPFQSPPSLQVEFETPNKGVVRGMGIREGVNIIAGGGFHGKSTLLHAIEKGIYGHIPGDGRELVATRGDAVKIRSEDGRSITDVNISPFINDLPYGKDTQHFSTVNASGSTSQAANIVEALECGARAVLIDEDTSATNFMIRDNKIREIVKKEPITPLIDIIRSMYTDHGISSIIVTGGAGDYLTVADSIILMEDYLPSDITDKVEKQHHHEHREMFNYHPSKRSVELPSFWKGKKEVVKARGVYTIQAGHKDIDLIALEQLIEFNQTESIAFILKQFKKLNKDNRKAMTDTLMDIYTDFKEQGFETILSGAYALPRPFEVIFAINRIRELKVVT